MNNTEHLILESAKKVFTRKGMAGSRMQEIADEAGINKSLLHYYYRNKKKLFLAVFQGILKQVITLTEAILKSNLPIEKKLEEFIRNYSAMLLENPYLPGFIIQEINNNPNQLAEIFLEAGLSSEKKLIIAISEEIAMASGRNIDPRHFIVNILSLTIFPLAAKPMLQRVLFENNEKEYLHFLSQRQKILPKMILQSMRNFKK